MLPEHISAPKLLYFPNVINFIIVETENHFDKNTTTFAPRLKNIKFCCVTCI